MSKFIKILRWFFSIFLSLALVLIMIVSIAVSSITGVITNSSKIKKVLNEGGVYENLSNTIVKIVEEQEDEKVFEEISLEKEDLKKSIDKVLEMEWVKNNMEKVVDATYEWLNGKTEIPTFHIDLNDRVEILASEVSIHFKNQVESLPDCTQAQEENIDEDEFNPMEAECRPSAITDNMLDDINKEIEKEFQKQLSENDEIQNGVLKSEELINIKKEKVEKIQNVYAHIKRTTLYALGVVIVLSLVLFLMVPKFSNKLIVLGVSWTIPGILILFGTFILENNYMSLIQENLKDVENKDLILEAAQEPIKVLANTIFSKMRIYSIVFVGLGLLFFGIIVFTKLSSKKVESLEVTDSEE